MFKFQSGTEDLKDSWVLISAKECSSSSKRIDELSSESEVK